MIALVTGASGFVGSQLAADLARRGHTVRVLCRSCGDAPALQDLPLQRCAGDILDPDAVAAAVDGCEAVFHVAGLASYWRSSRADVYHVNVDGTRCVLQGCRVAGVRRVVVTSSVAAVGVSRDATPLDETASFDAFGAGFVYGDSKRLAEAEVRRAVDAGLDAVIVNPAAVIGPGDANLVSGSLVVQYARHGYPFVTAGGMCMVDIASVVEGHIGAYERGRTGERYILGGENLTHREIATTIAELAGRTPPWLTIPGAALPAAAYLVEAANRALPGPPVISGEQIRLSGLYAWYDSSKAVRELGFPLLPFRPAAERAYLWYKAHGYLG